MQPVYPMGAPQGAFRFPPSPAFLVMVVLVVVGGLLFGIPVFVAMLLYRSDAAIGLVILAVAGLMTGFSASIGAALAAPSEGGHLRLGFLILAAVFLYLVTTFFRPYSNFP